LSKFLSDYTNIPGQDVNDEHDLIKAIQHQQNLSNQNRMRKCERAILAYQILLEVPEETEITKLKFPFISIYHSFVFTKAGLELRVLRGDVNKILTPFNTKVVETSRKYKQGYVYEPLTKLK
jgi:hypothetical protein